MILITPLDLPHILSTLMGHHASRKLYIIDYYVCEDVIVERSLRSKLQKVGRQLNEVFILLA